MEQSPAWEAKRFSASQGIPHILRNPKVHYCIYKNLPTCLYPESDQSSPYPPPTQTHFLKIHLDIIHLGLPSSLCPSGFPIKTLCTPLLYPPYMQDAPPISFFLIWSPEQYWVRSTDH